MDTVPVLVKGRRVIMRQSVPPSPITRSNSYNHSLQSCSLHHNHHHNNTANIHKFIRDSRGIHTSTSPRFTHQEQHDIFLSDTHSSLSLPPTSYKTTRKSCGRRANLKELAAESEWLQEDESSTTLVGSLDVEGSSTFVSGTPLLDVMDNNATNGPITRFDWRQRAPSRCRKLEKTAEVSQDYIRRKQPPLVKVLPGEPFYDAIQSYSNHFLPLIAAEEAEDEAVLKERLSTWGVDKLKEEGYCVTGLSAFWLQENQFGRPVASFLIGPGMTLPEHRFENGTQVLVSRLDPLSESPLRGSVISSTASQIRVCFPEQFNEVDQGMWRLDLGRPNLIFERMRTAISNMHHDPQRLEEVSAGWDGRQYILQGTFLKDVLLRSFEPGIGKEGLSGEERSRNMGVCEGAFKDDMRIQSWARRYTVAHPVVIEGDPPLENLNASQKRAVATMIGKRISLIQGPPGTGKTKTIIETIKLLKLHFEVPQPILVCTYTNVAVDNLVEGLAKAGVKPLRVGYGGALRAELVPYSLDDKLLKHPLQKELLRVLKEEERCLKEGEVLREKIRSLEAKIGEVGAGVKARNNREERLRRMKIGLVTKERICGVLRSKKFAMKQQMLSDVVGDADVICTTCITSACMALNVTDFPVVFIDEASMSTEPASLIPLMKGSQHVALVGDHKQLPPVITSREAQALGLGVSLFERLTEEGVVPSVMLDIQYRMHPDISRFPSSEFYNFTLLDGTVDAVGNIHPKLAPPNSLHLRMDETTGLRPSLIFLDHNGREMMKNRSKINVTEAHIVLGVVEDLLINNPNLKGKDIGIIAPYVAQIALLNRLLTTDTSYQQRFKKTLGDHGAMQLANVEIKTVDGFEGREKEVIIFSTVRNNSGGHIGFLADKRRLNVGLTRARRGLFVVGNIEMLLDGRVGGERGTGVRAGGKGVDSWRRYARYLTDRGLVVSLLPRNAGVGDSAGIVRPTVTL